MDHGKLTVSFHWHLVALPPELIDYVVVHELAHLHEPNHGKEFWRRVEDVLPDFKARRRRLRSRGTARLLTARRAAPRTSSRAASSRPRDV